MSTDCTSVGFLSDAWVGSAHPGNEGKLQWMALERLEKFQSEEYWTDSNLSSKRMYRCEHDTIL
jgi:hypothetical protein